MSVSSSNGGQKKCCDPCGNCYKGNQPVSRKASKSSSCCSGSKKGTGRWVCTLTNQNQISGTRCSDDQQSNAEWRCVVQWNWSGSPTYQESGCPGKGKNCAQAMIQAQRQVQDLHPEQKPKTSINWVPAPSNTCSSLRCPGGPCATASYSPPDLNGKTIDEEATWNC
jgi:hypothetical protein